MTQPDFLVHDHNDIVFFTPMTKKAMEWAKHNIGEDDRLHHNAIAVPDNKVNKIINGAKDDKLIVKVV